MESVPHCLSVQRGLLRADFPSRAYFAAHTYHRAKCLAVVDLLKAARAGRSPPVAVLLTALSLSAVAAAELRLQWLGQLRRLETHLERDDGTPSIASIIFC